MECFCSFQAAAEPKNIFVKSSFEQFLFFLRLFALSMLYVIVHFVSVATGLCVYVVFLRKAY